MAGLLGAVTANPLMARQFATARQNMTAPTSVMDDRYPAWKKSQDQATQFLLAADVVGSAIPAAMLGAPYAKKGLLAAGEVAAPKLESYMYRQGLLNPIVSPEQAAMLSTKRALPNDDLFKMAVQNTSGASISDDGLRLALQRNQVPEQAMEQSVRGGVFYLPEGVQQAKHYSTGRNGYGGTEKITGETVIHNPLFVKGATGGKAPEAAMDSLLGKGSYEAMRKDALRVRHPDLIRERGDSLPGAISPEDFLAKYAPDLQGMGDHIFRNSRKGNQLAYALQEAAAGSAARQRGHDAIVGYSKSTKTKQPFISEVFDVREMNYPEKGGGLVDVWNNFK